MVHAENCAPDILKICEDVLDFLKKDPSGRPKKRVLASQLQAAIEAESRMRGKKKKSQQRDVSYFGHLGRHYDFVLTVQRFQLRAYGYRIECSDALGRAYTVKAQEDEVSFLLKPGMHLFFRGRVTAKRSIYKKPVTFLQVVSGLKKVKDPAVAHAHL